MRTSLPLITWTMPRKAEESAFLLPGSDSLLSFAGLWEDSDKTEAPVQESYPNSLSDDSLSSSSQAVSLPVFFSETDRIPDSLTCTFHPEGQYDHAFLCVPPLVGKGFLTLNGHRFLSFCSFSDSFEDAKIHYERFVDVTPLLHVDQNNLTICFEPACPAGILDIFSLRFSQKAWMALVAGEKQRNLVSFGLCVDADEEEILTLTVSPLEGDGTPLLQEKLSVPARRSYHDFTFSVFHPAYYRFLLQSGDTVCDELIYPIGPQRNAAPSMLPLPAEDATMIPDKLIEILSMTGQTCLFTDTLLAQGTLNRLMESHIQAAFPEYLETVFPPAIRFHPASVFLSEPTPMFHGIGSAWQLCGRLSTLRALPMEMTEGQLTYELFGMDNVSSEILEALHLLLVRFHAESVRQGTGSGLICARDEWNDSEVMNLLTGVFSSQHISIAPVKCTVFPGSNLLCSIQLFWPDPLPENAVLRLVLFDPYSKEDTSSDEVQGKKGNNAGQSEVNTEKSLFITFPSGVLLYSEIISCKSALKGPVLKQIALPEKTGLLFLECVLSSDDVCLESVTFPVFVDDDYPLRPALHNAWRLSDPKISSALSEICV